jgi:hypothetical protein
LGGRTWVKSMGIPLEIRSRTNKTGGHHLASLAKHFADTFSRIGLPEPYPTE